MHNPALAIYSCFLGQQLPGGRGANPPLGRTADDFEILNFTNLIDEHRDVT